MLVIAMSNRHAAAVLDFVQRRFPQYRSGRIGQDVPAPRRARLLEAYRQGDLDVMVQVDMIGEGTDIKPISVIVKADLVRALSKTMQQVFRGMRYLTDWPEAANVCDIYAANDSEVVATLEWITSEEQIGVKQRKRTNREAPEPPEPTDREPWHLKRVEHRSMQTHRLDVSSEAMHWRSQPYADDAPQVVDVNQREQDLRKECAELATEVAYALQARGKDVTIRAVHARAKQQFSKAQGDLSLPELERKRRWLQKCLRNKRLL
jgi:superfamily II DNA or RNA helicase